VILHFCPLLVGSNFSPRQIVVFAKLENHISQLDVIWLSQPLRQFDFTG
jgi:hypothetical protein